MIETTRSPELPRQHQRTTEAACNPSSSQTAESIIRQRRSAQSFDPATSHISYESFVQTLSATLPRECSPFDALPTTTNLHLVIFVHQVERLSPGLYCLVRDIQDLKVLQQSFADEFSWERIDQDIPLYLLVEGDVRTAAARASCHQAIAGDSTFSLCMLARFESLLKGAPWLYPCLFWESGIIGQVLYLEAEQKGLRGTGIGCFFDDVIHQLLKLADHEWQDLYHFTIGMPVEDTRLQTLRLTVTSVIMDNTRAPKWDDFASLQSSALYCRPLFQSMRVSTPPHGGSLRGEQLPVRQLFHGSPRVISQTGQSQESTRTRSAP
ncbi:MAG: SagB/ThcOx family dehydrogenase [Gammaproteobacteria bacterium]|nr:SagB/ThcOx family dehydrogenase [Gammaproteobacteria bacterium]